MKQGDASDPKGILLVTGASGFVGRALVNTLASRGIEIRGAFRTEPPPTATQVDTRVIGEIGAGTDWSAALESVDCVIHCAGCAQANSDRSDAVDDQLYEVNVAGTRRLAEQAAQAGVRRLVFVSSVKVNGESFDQDDRVDWQRAPSPQGPYARSKWEAERALQVLSATTPLEVVVVRPPLVYGPGVTGNFQRLMALIRRRIPLPLASINNRRAMVGVDNLVDLLAVCVSHPEAAGQTFMISDGEDLSTPDLMHRLGKAMGLTPRLFRFPARLLRGAGGLLGRTAEVERLVGSLAIDIQHTRETLDWSPPVSVDEGLARIFHARRN
jgi:nucleoside-diphosphate-sugar epimerase